MQKPLVGLVVDVLVQVGNVDIAVIRLWSHHQRLNVSLSLSLDPRASPPNPALSPFFGQHRADLACSNIGSGGEGICCSIAMMIDDHCTLQSLHIHRPPSIVKLWSLATEAPWQTFQLTDGLGSHLFPTAMGYEWDSQEPHASR